MSGSDTPDSEAEYTELLQERSVSLHNTLRSLQARIDRMTLEMQEANPDSPAELPRADRRQFPNLRSKIPPVYILYGGRAEFIKKRDALLASGIEIRKAMLVTDTVRCLAKTMADYKRLIHFCNIKAYPYFTHGLPEKRKLKVVVKGLPADINLDLLKREIQIMKIPVCRVHKMHTTVGLDRPFLVLVVVNHNDNGKKMLQVNELMGHVVTLERLLVKPQQCHRCQKWGHSQRYCHWAIKCVKCAGNHFSNKCKRNRNLEPPKCANCNGGHTANYKECSYCPLSKEYQKTNVECGRNLRTGARRNQELHDQRECKNLLIGN